MKKVILLTAAILLSTTAFAQEGELSGTVDVTFLSQYIWRGFEMYGGNMSAIQPSIDLDLYGTGLGLKVLWSRANSSGYEADEELRYTLTYDNSLFENETYATNYQVGWTYYDFPHVSSDHDMQEYFATLSWPEICPEGIVPSYTIIKMSAAQSNSPLNSGRFSELGGWLHVLGLGYDLTLEGLLPETPEQILHLSAEMWYNGGAAAAGVDHDWSHAVFGVSTDFDLGYECTLRPGVYYQSSWEDTVNRSDEFWCSVGVSYAF